MVQTKLQMTLKLNNNWLNWFTFKIDIVYYYKSNLIINTLVNHISKHNWNKFATADTSEGAPFSNSPRHIWQLKPFNLPPFFVPPFQLHRFDTFPRDIVYFPWNGIISLRRVIFAAKWRAACRIRRRKEKQRSCCTIDLGDSLFTELARLEVEKRKEKKKKKRNDGRGG